MSERSSGNGDGPTPYNAASDLLGRNLTPTGSERIYLKTPLRGWSYEEVAHASDAAGAGLLNLGLEQGDRVVMATRDRPEFIATFWGAIKAGLVPVPVAPMLSASDLHFILTDSEARAMVCDASSVRRDSGRGRDRRRVHLRRREGGRGHEDLARCVWETVGPGPGSNHRGRHRPLVVHIGNDRAAQGRDASTSPPPRGSGRLGQTSARDGSRRRGPVDLEDVLRIRPGQLGLPARGLRSVGRGERDTSDPGLGSRT